jgi:hypothetical protein
MRRGIENTLRRINPLPYYQALEKEDPKEA